MEIEASSEHLGSRNLENARFVDRARSIEAALEREVWLPIGLRTLIAGEIGWIRKRLEKGSRLWQRKVSRRVHELALATYHYSKVGEASEVVNHLRILDLELNPRADAKGSWRKDAWQYEWDSTVGSLSA